MDATLEEQAQDRVERLVCLAEVHAGAAVAQVLETGPAGRARPERLAGGGAAPGAGRVHLRQPLPRLSDTSGEQIAGDAEVTVADAPFTGGGTPVEVLDPHVAVLDDPVAVPPEQRPDLARQRVHLERERVVLHRPELSPAMTSVSSAN